MKPFPLIVGNWKMYKTSAEVEDYISALAKEKIASKERSILLALPFTCIEAAASCAQGTGIQIGAQNMRDQEEGAFTGEVSSKMLLASGATFVLLGHSERRQYFHEENSFIRRKVQRALQEGITPILCIGEDLKQREEDYKKVLSAQLTECLQGIDKKKMTQLIIAYEPVWAIGTGKTATPEIAQSAHLFIRHFLEEQFGKEISQKIPLLYGGPVKPDTIASLMQQEDIDGVLVGGASLDVKTFAQIVNY